jgi:Prenylcysteine lyase
MLPTSNAGTNASAANVSQDYDIVIIARPLTADFSPISLDNIPAIPPTFRGHYHTTYTYLVQGQLNASRLGVADDGGFGRPPTNFFFIDPKERLASISRLRPVDADFSLSSSDEATLEGVYKIFSRERLSPAAIGEFFIGEPETVDAVDWLAYPHYPSNKVCTIIRLKQCCEAASFLCGSGSGYKF